MSSRQRARATVAMAPRATLRTPTCSRICCVRMAPGSVRCSRNPMPFGRCAPWCADATTWSPPGYSSLTNCAACSTSFWPGAAAIFAEIDSPIALAFVQRYPTPASARRAAKKNASPHSSPNTATVVDATPPSCLSGCAPPPLAMPRRSKPTPRQSGSGARRDARVPWSNRSPSSPRASSTPSLSSPTARSSCRCRAPASVCAAQILAELGDVRERFPTDAQLAAEAGVAPLTYRVGQAPQRRLPLGLQPSPALAPSPASPTTRVTLRRGRPRVYAARPRSRLRSSTRHPHPRPRLDSRPVAHVDRSPSLTTPLATAPRCALNAPGG